MKASEVQGDEKVCLCGGCPCHAGRDATVQGEMPLFKNILFIQEAS